MLEGEDKLIKGSQTGKSADFGQIYDHYLPQIYRFVLMKVGHKQEAEDLVHEVFISAWQNISSYLPRGFPFSSWLYQIARNKVIDFYRVKKTTVAIEMVDESLFKIIDAVEKNLDTDMDLKRVSQAIIKLTPDQQDVVLMRFVEDLSHQEISAALDKSEGAIRLLQHRAINNLKNILEKDDGGQIV